MKHRYIITNENGVRIVKDNKLAEQIEELFELSDYEYRCKEELKKELNYFIVNKAKKMEVGIYNIEISSNERNNYPVVEPNLQFYGVEDQYDIDEQLRAYKTRCKRNDFATCNLLGKYYLQYGAKGRQEAYKWYSVGCNQHKNPYACGVKKYLEAGGY